MSKREKDSSATTASATTATITTSAYSSPLSSSSSSSSSSSFTGVENVNRMTRNSFHQCQKLLRTIPLKTKVDCDLKVLTDTCSNHFKESVLYRSVDVNILILRLIILIVSIKM